MSQQLLSAHSHASLVADLSVEELELAAEYFENMNTKSSEIMEAFELALELHKVSNSHDLLSNLLDFAVVINDAGIMLTFSDLKKVRKGKN